MTEESSSAPPRSVIISPGVSQDGTEQYDQGVQITTSQEHITNFHQIRSQKPDVGLSVIGAVFFLLPIIILVFSDDLLDMIPICCLFWLIGFVLVLINSTQTSNWNKEMKKARKKIESIEKIPYPPVPQWPQVVGTLFVIGGFIGADYDGIVFIIGGIIGSGFILYHYYLVHRQNKAFDAVVDQLK